jgi:hypothetical protein
MMTTIPQDDGTPDQYDLPPPRSASDLIKEEALKPEEDKKEDAEITDDLRWARDRTGWAPQFEKPQTEEEKAEGTLLDHQDFLESKLDDKFFGGERNLHHAHVFSMTIILTSNLRLVS